MLLCKNNGNNYNKNAVICEIFGVRCHNDFGTQKLCICSAFTHVFYWGLHKRECYNSGMCYGIDFSLLFLLIVNSCQSGMDFITLCYNCLFAK